MRLQAKKTRVPFIGLAIVMVLIVAALSWNFLIQERFTWRALVDLTFCIAMILIPASFLYIGFRRDQSVEIDEHGVNVEVLGFSTGKASLPQWRRVLLRWNEVLDIRIQGNTICLKSSVRTIRINVFYFNNAENLLEIIDTHVEQARRSRDGR